MTRKWSFTGVYVTGSLFMSPRHFSLFWPILVMLGWSPLVLRFTTLPTPLREPLEIVPSTSITISITITFMLHSFFGSLARSKYLYLFPFFVFLFFFIFTLWSTGTAKSTIQQTLFIIILRQVLSTCISFRFFFFVFFFHFHFVIHQDGKVNNSTDSL